MTDTNTRSASVQVGPGIGGVAILMTVLLIVLKVAGVLEISWLISFLPVLVMLGMTGAALLILVCVIIVGLIVVGIGSKVEKRRFR